MKKSLQEQLEFIFEGNDRKVTMDMVRLTDDQLEELIKQYPLVDDEEISENEIKNLNEVVARVNGKNIKLDSISGRIKPNHWDLIKE